MFFFNAELFCRTKYVVYISTTYIFFSTRGDLRNSNTVLAQYWLLKEKFWEVKVRNTQTEKIIGGNQVAKQ